MLLGLIGDDSYEKQYQLLLTQYKVSRLCGCCSLIMMQVITTALTQGASPFDVEKFIKDNHMQVGSSRSSNGI